MSSSESISLFRLIHEVTLTEIEWLNASRICNSGRLHIRKRNGSPPLPTALPNRERKHCCIVSPAHSSTPSIIAIPDVRNGELLSAASWNGLAISRSNCVWIERVGRKGSLSMAVDMCALISGTDDISCHAKVGKSRFASLHWGSLKKKKAAPSLSFARQCSAIVWAIADFPTPAEPYNHRIRVAPSSSPIQSFILVNTLSRVPGWHFGGGYRTEESWKAPWATYFASSWMPEQQRSDI